VVVKGVTLMIIPFGVPGKYSLDLCTFFRKNSR